MTSDIQAPPASETSTLTSSKKPLFDFGSNETGDLNGAIIARDLDANTAVRIDHRIGGDESGNPLTVVIGDSGSGKTMLAMIMAYQFDALGVAGAYINPQFRSTEEMDSLARHLSSGWKFLAPPQLPLDDGDAARWMSVNVRSQYERLASNGGGVLLIEEAQAIVGDSEKSEFDWLCRSAQAANILPVLFGDHARDFASHPATISGSPSRRITLRQRPGPDAREALSYLGLENPSVSHEALLTDSGFRNSPEMPSSGFMRHVNGSISRVMFGPLDQTFIELVSPKRWTGN